MYRKLGILGGTFNPIHNGHIALAKEACKHFSLHRVFLIPSGIPPHKEVGNIAAAKDRYDMTCLAAKEEDFLSVLDIEIKRKIKAYTVDTLEEIQENSVDKPRIIFIIGADIIFEILTWKEPEKILKMCELALFERPGYINEALEKEIKKLKKEYGAKIHRVEMEPVDISSSEIRDRVAEGKSIKGMLPESVEEFIYENNLYKEKPNKQKDDIENLKNILKKNISFKRYTHSLNVMNVAEKLAVKWGENVKDAKVAGLLHDCGKLLDCSDLLNICEENKVKIDKIMRQNPEALLHAFAGKIIAMQKYEISDKKILEAIENHTLGSDNMSLLSKIVFISDYIEEGRNFPGVEELRDLAFINLDVAVIKALDSTIEKLKNEGKVVHDRAIKTRNSLKIDTDIHKDASQ